jgi:nucleoside phosphorylase
MPTCYAILFKIILCQLTSFLTKSCVLAGVDSVGTVPVAVVTSFSIQTLKPDLIINAGTAGGFKVCTRTLLMFAFYVLA